MRVEPIRVLLIEDDPAYTCLIQGMLTETHGASVTLECVARLQEGLERLARGHIDVVLLDLTLTGDSLGLQTLSKVRAQVPMIPVIVLTALADEDVGRAALRKGAKNYLVKDQVDGGTLRRVIQDAVGERNEPKGPREGNPL